MRVAHEISSLQFIYPFAFDRVTFHDRTHAIGRASWHDGDKKLGVWRKRPFAIDDLMVHVARYLNPPPGIEPTMETWCLDERALTSASGLGIHSGSRQSSLLLHALHRDIPFTIDEVTLAVFHTGIGFLTISAKPQSDDADAWLDFLHAFRFIRRSRQIHIAMAHTGADGQEAPYFPPSAGGVDRHPKGTGTINDIVDALLHTGTLSEETHMWWSDVFVPGRLLPFASLFVDNATDSAIPSFRYRVRHFFHATQGANPSEYDLRDDGAGMFEYAERQWFLFSLDGGAFIAYDAPQIPFFRENLPQHLRSQYFLILLLALHQRFFLARLSGEVAENWPVRDDAGSLEERMRLFRRIESRLLSFTARGYFAQIVQREHHHQFYQRWQETFQLDRLYDEVRTEVDEMHDYLLTLYNEEAERQQREQQLHAEAQARAARQREHAAEERAHRLERRISTLAIFIGIPTLIIGFLGIDLIGFTQSGILLWQALFFVVAGTLTSGGLALFLVARDWRARAEKREGGP